MATNNKNLHKKTDRIDFPGDNVDIERLLGTIREAIMQNSNGNLPPCPISEAVEKYLEVKTDVLSPHTISDYSLTFRRFTEYFGPEADIKDIEPADIRAFLATIPGGKKNKKNAHIALSALWTFLVAEHCSADHIVRRVEVAKHEIRAIIPFSREEIEKMVKVARSTGRERKRDVAILLTLVDTGVRASELCGLRLSDLEGNLLRVLGKGSKERFVPVGPVAMQAILDYMGDRPPGKRHAPVFLSEDGAPLNRDALRRIVGRIGTRAGVLNAHPHKFRHTFAINYLLNGGDPYTLQMILGHSTMDMVKRYLYLTNKDVSSVHARSSPLANWHIKP
jgi:integrase/recombinase XerD